MVLRSHAQWPTPARIPSTLLHILDIAAKILFVVVFFGLCIFIHELGHLLVALWRKLYVERFSVGFGKKLNELILTVICVLILINKNIFKFICIEISNLVIVFE